MGMRICNENESISSIKRSGRAHDKDCNKKRKRHPIHSCDNFKIAKRNLKRTLHLSALVTKIAEKMGMRAKLIRSPGQSWMYVCLQYFSLTQYLHENMHCHKCYLLENVIFSIFYFFLVLFLSLLSISFLFHSLLSSLFFLLPFPFIFSFRMQRLFC